LHRTGGNEDDLIPLGRMVALNSALLSPRGKVMEGGMPGFFRRLAEGVFDEADGPSNLLISSVKRVRPTALLRRSHSAIRTGQTLRQRYCSCGRMYSRERSCCGPW